MNPELDSRWKQRIGNPIRPHQPRLNNTQLKQRGEVAWRQMRFQTDDRICDKRKKRALSMTTL
jgi:hypothetical protein